MTNTQGFSLVEVLIAWFILSSTLLAILAQQLQQMQRVRESYFYSVAVVRLASMMERLRVNATSVSRQREYRLWDDQNLQLLPRGHGDFSCQQNICTVDLEWRVGKKHSLKITGIVQ